MYRVSRLENGLTVATAAMPQMASVSVGLCVGVGSRHEPAPLNGVSHFIEHMLFKGTRRRSPRQISQAVEGIGGSLNAWTGEDSSCFHSKARHDRFEELLEVLMDMFLHSTFGRSEIERERAVIKEELALYLDQPSQHVHELLHETLWPGHALGRPLTGTAETIDGLSRARLLAYKQQNYTASTTLVAAAGRLRHEPVVRAVRRFAPHFLSGQPPPCSRVNDRQTAPRVRLLHRPVAQTQLALGLRTCSRHDERRFALRLLNALLGENMSSRLFQVVREDRGLAYSIQSSLSFYEDVGSLEITAGLDTGNLVRVLKLIRRELRRFIEERVGRRELRAARDYLIGELELGLEGTENQMTWLADHLVGYRRVVSPRQFKQRLQAVTGAEVQKVAQDFFRPERMSLALISPLKRARGLGDLLGV